MLAVERRQPDAGMLLHKALEKCQAMCGMNSSRSLNPKTDFHSAIQMAWE